MSTRTERDKAKAFQERHQAILSALLKDEDNKYCVDCDAKGPRWASWNLGIFLCIRCAGIHRNLGVHISKVKSVNLDTWTQEQIAMMQEMGNSRARAVYEANLMDNFRRPQTDSGLEAFIRAKYEQKKYIAREWIPPQNKIPQYVQEEPKKEKKKPSKASAISLNSVPSPAKTVTSAAKQRPSAAKPELVVVKKPDPPKASAAVDLLGLDDTPSQAAANLSSNDLFGDFISSTVAPNSPTDTTNNQAAAAAAPPTSNAETLGDINLFGGVENGAAGGGGGAAISTEAVTGKKSKDSILALYGSGAAAQAGGGGMPQQQQQQMFGAMQGGMYGGAMMNGMMQQQPHNAMMQQQQQQHPQVAAMMGGMPQQQQQQQQAYNMSAMYGMQQQNPQAFQQQQFQQMHHQFGGMSMGGNNPAAGYPQMAAAAAGGGGGGGAQWGGQQPAAGHTLSNNLWQ